MSNSQTTLTGILVDVSGSMRNTFPGGNPDKPWVRSIFNVINNLIKEDVSQDNQVFAIGFGASTDRESSTGLFDVLGTIDSIKLKVEPYRRDYTHQQRVTNILSILMRNGAPYIRDWIKDESVAVRNSSEDDSALFLYKLNTDDAFMQSFVADCLPRVCREGLIPETAQNVASSILGPFAWIAHGANSISTVVAAEFEQASDSDIKKVVAKAKRLIKGIVVSVTDDSIFDAHKASTILNESVGEEKLSDERIEELTKSVEPYIYGRTPIFGALKCAIGFFSKPQFKKHKKLLFVLSDGVPTDWEPTDWGQPAIERTFLSLMGVAMPTEEGIDAIRQRITDTTVNSCYITQESGTCTEPLRLYNTKQQDWEVGAKFMFDLASTYKTQSLPRAIFARRKTEHQWKIDFETNETRLFVQVNHPDNIRDVCDMAKSIVCAGDALSGILASVDLDLYIKRYHTRYTAQARRKQIGGTCYAHASAVALHLAMKRILGRDGGYPEFSDLRDEMIKEHGSKGANTLDVLRAVCPRYRLRCREVDITGALEAVAANRPVVANFRLTDDEWRQYVNFFDDTSTGRSVITKDQVDISRRPPGAAVEGHAVVLTTYTSECLRFMDSWGWDWADNGFIKVKNYKVLDMKFFDVFWKKGDLSEREQADFKAHGPDVAAQLMQKLKGLRHSSYMCPLRLCSKESSVTDFTGNIGKAKCPKYKKFFKASDSGNILALNMYLTSISSD